MDILKNLAENADEAFKKQVNYIENIMNKEESNSEYNSDCEEETHNKAIWELDEDEIDELSNLRSNQNELNEVLKDFLIKENLEETKVARGPIKGINSNKIITNKGTINSGRLIRPLINSADGKLRRIQNYDRTKTSEKGSRKVIKGKT